MTSCLRPFFDRIIGKISLDFDSFYSLFDCDRHSVEHKIQNSI